MGEEIVSPENRTEQREGNESGGNIVNIPNVQNLSR